MGTTEMIIIGVVAGLCFGGGAIFMTLRFFTDEVEYYEKTHPNENVMPMRPHEDQVTEAEARLGDDTKSA